MDPIAGCGPACPVVWEGRQAQSCRLDPIATPVLANGRVYCLSDQGVATLFELKDEFELVARNDLGEPVSASSAISQGQLFIRSQGALYCIGKR